MQRQLPLIERGKCMFPHDSKARCTEWRPTEPCQLTLRVWGSQPASLSIATTIYLSETAAEQSSKLGVIARFLCSPRLNQAFPPTTWPSGPKGIFLLPVQRPRVSTRYTRSIPRAWFRFFIEDLAGRRVWRLIATEISLLRLPSAASVES